MSHPSLYRALLSRKVALGATLGGAVTFMFIGVALWGGFNWSLEETNSMEFCISCHEMEDNVYAEYKGTIHDSNRSGVQAGCPDCHVPRPWVHKIKRKVQASNEVWHKLVGTVDTPEKFNEHRLAMAKRVWKAMKETDSRECRNCHDLDSMSPERQKPRARQQHMNAMEKGHTCIDCHKGIAHTAVHEEMGEEELAALNEPDPALAREVPEAYKASLARVEAAEAEEQAKQQEQTRKEREARKASKEAEKKRIEEAVAAALTAEAERAAQAAQSAQAGQADATAAAPQVPTAPASAPAGGQGFGVDWSAVPERLATIFYPGQTSMEWTLVGKYHGGARPFRDGDRCTTCHDKETALMGPRMSTGQKAEPTPLPDKRAYIPVTVQAAHDQENLYLRFQWDDTDHVPVPFVDGGKMDPENQVKLAVMFGGDDVIYASQSGCWGTCHHDLRTMPEHPEDPTTSGLALDFSKGVTKYIKESRSKVEEKGRRGAKLGGWDKLKTDDEIQGELAAGHFMDLLRWSASGKVENGHVLAQRVMSDGTEGVEAQGYLDGGTWTVVIRRKLASGQPGDLAIEPGKTINFGFAIHDDYADARFHHVSLGYKLALDNAEAEINAVEAQVQAPATAAVPAPAAEVAASAPTTEVAAPTAPAAEVATAPVAATEATAPAAPAAGGAEVDAGVDWSKAGERLITIFYPGQTSMEWSLVGKYHGGARPFKDGDTCVTCHDKETALMGTKMVTGEKAEPTPIPGKRGNIPVTLQSTHDGENLYLRFQWEGADHVPVPFVDGGKMDPDNQVKLALMFAPDDVIYAGQSGCWGTCHHDLRSMPEHPEDAAASGLALDLSEGVTKYIKESRTKVEEKGRRGAKLGGWDKLKTADEIQAELAAGHFMDLLRVNSDGSTEDGHVLDQRVMTGGQGFESQLTEDAGYWTLVIKRKLVSDQPGDLTIEPGKAYNFGFAIHDDYADARFHHVSLGYKLALDNADAEVNVQAQ